MPRNWVLCALAVVACASGDVALAKKKHKLPVPGSVPVFVQSGSSYEGDESPGISTPGLNEATVAGEALDRRRSSPRSAQAARRRHDDPSRSAHP